MQKRPVYTTCMEREGGNLEEQWTKHPKLPNRPRRTKNSRGSMSRRGPLLRSGVGGRSRDNTKVFKNITGTPWTYVNSI